MLRATGQSGVSREWKPSCIPGRSARGLPARTVPGLPAGAVLPFPLSLVVTLTPDIHNNMSENNGTDINTPCPGVASFSAFALKVQFGRSNATPRGCRARLSHTLCPVSSQCSSDTKRPARQLHRLSGETGANSGPSASHPITTLFN